jgi:cytochrome c-type biogenesis protein
VELGVDVDRDGGDRLRKLLCRVEDGLKKRRLTKQPNALIGAPSIALAFAAGFVSFVSPCCLPLVPGYLATVAGPATQGRSEGFVDRAVLGRSLLFIASFSSIFILLGLSATALGAFLFSNKPALERVAGVAIITMGLLMVGSVFVVRLNREWRPRWLVERAGRSGPVVVGGAFALAWTPCVGPTLGAILGLAAGGQSTARAGLLLGAYAAGLAVPFLACAISFDATQRSLAVFKRHYAAIQAGAGVLLVAMGVLVLNGELFRLNLEAQHFLSKLGLNFFQSV